MEELIRKIETIDASAADAFVFTANRKLTDWERATVARQWGELTKGTPLEGKLLLVLQAGESLTAVENQTTNEIREPLPLPGWEDAVWKKVLDAVLCTCFTYGDSDCPVHGKPTEAEHPTAECTCESLLGLRNCPACKAKRGESNG